MPQLTFDQQIIVESALRESICARYQRRHCYRHPAGIFPANPQRTAELYARLRDEIATLRLFLPKTPKAKISR